MSRFDDVNSSLEQIDIAFNDLRNSENAAEALKKFKDETCYFDGSLKIDDMYDMLLNRMHFGVAEANVILSALIICGAKFNGKFEVKDDIQ